MYDQGLNLVVKDSCMKVKCLKETFEAVREISLLVKKSPKRKSVLQNHTRFTRTVGMVINKCYGD